MNSKRLIVAAALLLLLFTHSGAQPNVRNFYLYNVDTSAFPRVTANVFALDNANQRYRNLSVTDFDLFENGSQRDATMTLNCDSSSTPLPVAVVLALDQSFSMTNKTPAGDTYWDWVKAGAKSFIDSLRMTPPTCVAITSFGGTAYVRSTFQTTKPPLYTALDQIPIEGGTNYDEAFLNLSAPSQSAAAVTVLRNAPAMLKRYIIILTDGLPDKPPSKQRIIDSCVVNGITVFAINLATPKSPNINVDLNEIAAKTNGKAYLARSKADLMGIYRLIALEMQRNIDCRLTWISNTGCTQQSRQRTLRAIFRKGTVTYTWNGQYTASYASLANPVPSVTTLSFSDPGTGSKVRKTLTVRAPSPNTIRIDRFVSSMPGVFSVISTSKPLPCTLSGTQTIDVIVEFTQTVTGTLHKATLDIQGSPCSQPVALNVIIPVLKLVTPVGGEALNGCDSIPIRWSGIAEDEAITIMSSSDNGVRWNVLHNDAYGLSWNWFNNVEHDAGTQVPLPYKIKVERSTPRWLVSIGGSGKDAANSIAYSRQTSQLCVGGYFEGTISYASNLVTSKGGRDAFVARMTTTGLPKALWQIGGSGDDEITSVSADSLTNIIVAGTTTSPSLLIGDSTLVFRSSKSVSSFIASIDTAGKARWVVGIGDTTGRNVGDFRATSVIVKADSTIVVQGYVTGTIGSIYTASSATNGVDHDAPSVNRFPLTIEISKKGVVTRMLDGFFQPCVKSARTSVLVGVETYQVGGYQGSLTAGRFTINAGGASDAFVRAVSLNVGADQSAKSFRITAPLVIFEVAQLDLPGVEVGTSRNFYVGQPMRSAGSVPLELQSLEMVGDDSLDFSVEPPLAPGVVAPFSSPEMRITVAPKPVSRRQRSAYLVANAPCNDPAFIRLRSFATFPSLSLSSVDFGRRRIGSLQYDTLYLANSDAGSVPVRGLRDSANTSASFTWNALFAADSMLQGKSTVPVIVSFSPKGIPEDSLVLRIDSSATAPVTVRGVASGSGYLPRAAVGGYAFKPVVVGTSSAESADIRISNADTIAKLRVYAGSWRNGVADAFSVSTQPVDSVLKVGDTVRLPLSFRPLTPGLHRAYYVFDHDAAPGPQLLPHAWDTVMVEGDAIDVVTSTGSLTFPTILRCDSAEMSVNVSNQAALTSVDVTSAIIEGSTDFSVLTPLPFTLAAGETQSIRIKYTPRSSSTAVGSLIIAHTGGQADTVLLSAASVTATLSVAATDTTIVAEISSKLLVNVRGEVRSSQPFGLDTMSFLLSTNPSQARFATERFVSAQNGWLWNVSPVGSSMLFTGTYSGTPPGSPLAFMSLPFDMYLSALTTNVMRLIPRTEYAQACLTHDTATVVIQEVPVCFLTGASIQLTSPLALRAQVASNIIDVSFILPTAMQAVFDIVTPEGSIIRRVDVDGREGVNSLEVPARFMASGVYFCRISAGTLMTSQPVLICR